MKGAAWFGYRDSNPNSMPGWSRSCPIVLPYTLVPTTQTNFPWVLATNATTKTAFPTEFWTYIQSNGADIRFTSDALGTIPLHFEIVYINVSTTTIIIWIKVPSISSSINTTIWVWYGNSIATLPLATDSTWGSQGVWDANHLMVLHCEQPSGNFLDSTSNNNYANPVNGSHTVGYTSSGEIGGAMLFDGSSINQIATVSNLVGLPTGNTARSAFCWINVPASRSIWFDIMVYGNPSGSSGSNSNLLLDTNNLLYFFGNGADFEGVNSITPNAWNHVGYTYDGTTLKLYVNGVSIDSQVLSLNTNSTPFLFGGQPTWGGYQAFSGNIDEVQFSNITRSSTWIQTCYNNQNAPLTSGTAGTPQ